MNSEVYQIFGNMKSFKNTGNTDPFYWTVVFAPEIWMKCYKKLQKEVSKYDEDD